jgi:hypothetical protein
MNSKSSTAAVVIVLAAALNYATTVPCQAQPVPATHLRQAVTLAQTKHADVDGDGRLDTVRIYNAGTTKDLTNWLVKVTTATGKVSSVKFPIPTYQTDRPWYGWAGIDGNRGAELLFETHSDDGLGLDVLTWRAGKLRNEKAPASPSDLTQQWGTWFAAQEGSANSGYRFFTYGGHRYVNAWGATCPDGGKACTLKTVKSVWRDGAWHRVAVLHTEKIAPNVVLKRHPLGALKVHS